VGISRQKGEWKYWDLRRRKGRSEGELSLEADFVQFLSGKPENFSVEEDGDI
jgi:hypothetical protein